jgi:hypothetical protein
MTPVPESHKLVDATGGAKTRTRVLQPHDAPMVFLVGPPGSGKSAGPTGPPIGSPMPSAMCAGA